MGRRLALPRHSGRVLPHQGRVVLRQPGHRAAVDHEVVQVDDRLGRQVVRVLRAAGQAHRQAAVRRRRQPLAGLLDRRRERPEGPLLPRWRGRARPVGVAALRGEHGLRRPRLQRLADRRHPQGALPRLRRPPDRLRARRQPPQLVVPDRVRRQPAEEPAPPDRARLVVQQHRRPRREPAHPVRRAGRRAQGGRRRLHRQPQQLRDERGRHRLQRRIHQRAGPALQGVRRHPADELPSGGDA